MDQTIGSELFSSLRHEEKIEMLAKIAYGLTIAARDTYDGHGDVKDSKCLRALNEIQHRVLASLCELVAGQSNARMPDDALVAMFFDQRDDKLLSGWLAFTFEKAANAIREAQSLSKRD